MLPLVFLVLCCWSISVIAQDSVARQFFDISSITGSTPSINVVPWPSSMPSTSFSTFFVSSVDVSGIWSYSSTSSTVSQAGFRFIRRLIATLGANNENYAPANASRTSGVLKFRVQARVFINTPRFGDDESYTLESLLQNDGSVLVNITSLTSTGVTRAFATVLHMLQRDPQAQLTVFPVGLKITDTPAFRWRGVLVDVARHFQPMDALMRVCDGMELSKLNVLHLHLTDDQGWRFQSFKWPLLQSRDYYTQADLQKLVSYCNVGGIRVVPEVTMPGHAGSALLAYPSLAPDYYPKAPITDWGVFDYILDPSVPATQKFVADILGELISVFSDAYVHVGGDEVLLPTLSPRQLAWMASQNVTADTLHGYFLRQIVYPALQNTGKKLIGWDEIYDALGGFLPLPTTGGIQWWSTLPRTRSVASVMSLGFFLDYLPQASDLFKNPLLNALDSGAEACMWTENVGSNLEARIFPSVLGFAELLWQGPARRRSVDDLYRRIFVVDKTLALMGLLHKRTFQIQLSALSQSPGTPWSYADLTNLSYPINVDADVEVLMSLLLPSSYRTVFGVPLMDVSDAAKADSFTLIGASWIASMALRNESLHPEKPATVALTNWLTRISQIKTLTFGEIGTDMSKLALSYLSWIKSVQSGTDGSALRRSALALGSSWYPGFVDPGKSVFNGLKAVLEPVLLQADVGPFNYFPASTSVDTFASTTTSAVETDRTAIIVGSAVGGSVFILAALLALLLLVFVMRAKTLKVVEEASKEEVGPVGPLTTAQYEDDDRNHYLDYIASDKSSDDDDVEDESIFVEIGIGEEFSTESLSFTSDMTKEEEEGENEGVNSAERPDEILMDL